MDPETEALHKALQLAKARYNGQGNVHTVYIGYKHVPRTITPGEQPEEEGVIVFQVGEKLTTGEAVARGYPVIPPEIEIDGFCFKTDVVADKMNKILRLPLEQIQSYSHDPLSAAHQACRDCPLHGGLQIAPEGAGWVGTATWVMEVTVPNGPRAGERILVIYTNYHVGVKQDAKVGDRLLQPGGGNASNYVATLAAWNPIMYGNNVNYIDGCMFDCWREDWGIHTMAPIQFQLGNLKTTPVKAKLGDKPHKSGRTTGVTQGTCIGIEAESHVGYDGGTAKFDRQLVVQDTNGVFSKAGDSGSGVVLDLQPWGVLFAGGGNTTIINPVEFVVEWTKARFLTMAP